MNGLKEKLLTIIISSFFTGILMFLGLVHNIATKDDIKLINERIDALVAVLLNR